MNAKDRNQHHTIKANRSIARSELISQPNSNVSSFSSKPKQLQDIAPGANPPFLLFNMEELTDVQKCEDFIEAELYPPRYPKLACKHPASNTIGNDIFAKFSALSKFRGKVDDPKREGMIKI